MMQQQCAVCAALALACTQLAASHALLAGDSYQDFCPCRQQEAVVLIASILYRNLCTLLLLRYCCFAVGLALDAVIVRTLQATTSLRYM
jgi:hypothetical protein